MCRAFFEAPKAVPIVFPEYESVSAKTLTLLKERSNMKCFPQPAPIAYTSLSAEESAFMLWVLDTHNGSDRQTEEPMLLMYVSSWTDILHNLHPRTLEDLLVVLLLAGVLSKAEAPSCNAASLFGTAEGA